MNHKREHDWQFECFDGCEFEDADGYHCDMFCPYVKEREE